EPLEGELEDARVLDRHLAPLPARDGVPVNAERLGQCALAQAEAAAGGAEGGGGHHARTRPAPSSSGSGSARTALATCRYSPRSVTRMLSPRKAITVQAGAQRRLALTLSPILKVVVVVISGSRFRRLAYRLPSLLIYTHRIGRASLLRPGKWRNGAVSGPPPKLLQLRLL